MREIECKIASIHEMNRRIKTDEKRSFDCNELCLADIPEQRTDLCASCERLGYVLTQKRDKEEEDGKKKMDRRIISIGSTGLNPAQTR